MIRNDIIKTPGKIILDAAGTPVSAFSAEGITAEVVNEIKLKPNQRWGASSKILLARLIRVELRPTSFTAALIAKLYTHETDRSVTPAVRRRKAQSIIGATDKTLDIHTVDGKRRRMASYFVYQEPPLQLKTGETIMGQVVLYGIAPQNTKGQLLSDYWVKSDAAWSDSDWVPGDELTPSWDAAWKANAEDDSSFADIHTKDGFVITPKSQLSEDKSNSKGLVNATLTSYGLEIAAQVMNITEDQVYEIGASIKPGQDMSALGRDLVFRSTSENAFITCKNAILDTNYKFGFDAENTVVGNLKWETDPLVTAGVKGPHLEISTSDPEA